MSPRAAIILAAGLGPRMKSSLPKVLHQVGGRPMLDWAAASASKLGCDPIVVVANPQSPEIARHLSARVALQDQPLGTAHAVRAAESALSEFKGDVIVL